MVCFARLFGNKNIHQSLFAGRGYPRHSSREIRASRPSILRSWFVYRASKGNMPPAGVRERLAARAGWCLVRAKIKPNANRCAIRHVYDIGTSVQLIMQAVARLTDGIICGEYVCNACIYPA